MRFCRYGYDVGIPIQNNIRLVDAVGIPSPKIGGDNVQRLFLTQKNRIGIVLKNRSCI